MFALHIDRSAVARHHSTGASGYVKSLSRQTSCDWHSMRSCPSRFLSAFNLTVFCLLDASFFRTAISWNVLSFSLCIGWWNLTDFSTSLLNKCLRGLLAHWHVRQQTCRSTQHQKQVGRMKGSTPCYLRLRQSAWDSRNCQILLWHSTAMTVFNASSPGRISVCHDDVWVVSALSSGVDCMHSCAPCENLDTDVDRYSRVQADIISWYRLNSMSVLIGWPIHQLDKC